LVKKSNVSQIDDYKVGRLAEEKLDSSGLDLADAKQLHIDILSSSQASPLLPEALREKNKRGVLKFTYHTIEGKPLIDKATKAPYYRVRLLGDDDAAAAPAVPQGAFGSVPIETKKRRPARYFQPAKSLPHPYFPTNLTELIYLVDGEWQQRDVTWSDLAQDPDLPVILTEGELKAAKACAMGYATIGLGGVHAWKSGPHGIPFLPELEDFLWHSRRVYICFDSDVMTKPAVAEALEQLSGELVDRGADVFIVLLPPIYAEGAEDKKQAPKTGLDDFFVHVPGAEEQFRYLLQEAQHFGLARPLFELNHKYVYVADKHFILNLKNLSIASPAQFRDTEGNVSVVIPSVKQGKVSYEKQAAPAQWLRWPLRGSVEGLVYRPCPPGSELRFVEGRYNTWRGYGCEPKPGDVGPFLKLIDHIFTDADPGAKEWFLRWLAYPLQKPSKMLTAAVLWGIEQGTGKSVIGNLMGQIYGENFSAINQSQLHSTFNPWAHNKQFIMGEEITGAGDKRSDANVLKDLISGKRVWVNQKNVSQYQIDNYINFLFTSNHPDAFYLEDKDRRYFIHHVTVGPLPASFYQGELRKWEDAGGVSHLFDYLLRLDLKGMHHDDRALETEAKRQMIEDVRSELSLWVSELRNNPDSVLRLGEVIHPAELFTSAQLLSFYQTQHDLTGTTTNAMGRELKRAGFTQVLRGSPIRTQDGLQNRYFVIRNPERWVKATMGQITSHLNQFVSRKK
jgi:hypothetical protein